MVLAEEIKDVARARAARDHEMKVDDLMRKVPNLRELPIVQTAGTDFITQFKAINAVIDDAVQRLEAEDDRASAAARSLFGLTDDTRNASWKVRQREAGKAYGISYESFRHAPQRRLIERIAQRMYGPAEPIADRGLCIYRDQAECEQELIEKIGRGKPKHGKLLEYSGFTAKNTLRALREVGCQTKLLLAHPASRPDGFQRRRIKAAIDDIIGVEFANARQFIEVRFYTTPASLRGRRFGEQIVVGWYTYRDDQRLDVESQEQVMLWGHDNVVVAGDTRTEQGAILASWFERQFDELWGHRMTRDDPALY